MLEVYLQTIFFFYLPKHLLHQKNSRLSHHLVSERFVNFGKTELPQVLIGYLMLVSVSQQKVQNFFCAYFGLRESSPQLCGNLHVLFCCFFLVFEHYGVLQCDCQMLLKVVKSRGINMCFFGDLGFVVLSFGVFGVIILFLGLFGDYRGRGRL